METRKEIKRQGRRDLKRHYFIFVAACLIAAFLSAEFRGSLNFSRFQSPSGQETQESGGAGSGLERISWEDLLRIIMQDDLQTGEEIAMESQQAAVERAEEGDPIFGRTRGVLAGLVNGFTSGSVLVTAVAAAASLTGSESGGVAVLVVLFALGMGLFWFLFQNVFPVVIRRVFLEGMCYQRVTPQRFVFLLRVRRWLRASWIMLVRYVYYSLWCLTVVGAVVKRYSYYLVPYLVAENPGMTARQAITLSRTMMKGHKWQCFLFELSFLGWEALGVLTLGLLNIFYTNPYKVAAFTRYYAQLRAQTIAAGLPGTELLGDTYLYEPAPRALIEQRYGDVLEVMEHPSTEDELPGWRGFLARNFGVLLLRRPQDRELERRRADYVRIHSLIDDVLGQAYPVRLYPMGERERRMLVESLNYMRHYSVWSLIAIFLSLSVFGWLWEVGLHLLSYGELVNRGVLHGPWLPIYGTGAVLMLTVLNRFRYSPVLEFVTTVVLCGFLEYMTSLVMEWATGGVRWWDYSGYFLNLNGRICAEGLLVFGVGGLIIVYVAAPMIDTALSRLPERGVKTVCGVLFALFLCDAVYSQFVPNMGSGVTDLGTADVAEQIQTSAQRGGGS
ncbi:MAG TPA: DUF975 family protein [Candidatus Galloscillospira stercoripullorum]|nr:DUF975 family protein [Candidatus Galloscillospira stercoripullorum]